MEIKRNELSNVISIHEVERLWSRPPTTGNVMMDLRKSVSFEGFQHFFGVSSDITSAVDAEEFGILPERRRRRPWMK